MGRGAPASRGALGPALGPPAAETAPKEKENLFVSACLHAVRTSSSRGASARPLGPAPPRGAGHGWNISLLVSLGGVLPVVVYRGEAPSLRHPTSPCGGRELGGGKPGREDLSGSPKIYQQAARREEFGTS